MQAAFHSSPVHIGGWAVALMGACVVSLVILLIAAARQSRKLHLIREWTAAGMTGNVFQGPAEWADINEAADRPLPSEESGAEQRDGTR